MCKKYENTLKKYKKSGQDTKSVTQKILKTYEIKQ